MSTDHGDSCWGVEEFPLPSVGKGHCPRRRVMGRCSSCARRLICRYRRQITLPGLREPEANCTIKRLIGAVRLRLSAPYAIHGGGDSDLGFGFGIRRAPFLSGQAGRIRNGVRRCRCFPGLPCPAADSSQPWGAMHKPHCPADSDRTFALSACFSGA